MQRLRKNMHTIIRQPPRPTLQLHLRQNNHAIQRIPHTIHHRPILLGKTIPEKTRNTTTQKNSHNTKRTKQEKTNNQHRKQDNHHTPHPKRRPPIQNRKSLQKHRLRTNKKP